MLLWKDDKVFELRKSKIAAFTFVTLVMLIARQVWVLLFGGEYRIARDLLELSIINGIIVFAILRNRFDE